MEDDDTEKYSYKSDYIKMKESDKKINAGGGDDMMFIQADGASIVGGLGQDTFIVDPVDGKAESLKPHTLSGGPHADTKWDIREERDKFVFPLSRVSEDKNIPLTKITDFGKNDEIHFQGGNNLKVKLGEGGILTATFNLANGSRAQVKLDIGQDVKRIQQEESYNNLMGMNVTTVTFKR